MCCGQVWVMGGHTLSILLISWRQNSDGWLVSSEGVGEQEAIVSGLPYLLDGEAEPSRQ